MLCAPGNIFAWRSKAEIFRGMVTVPPFTLDGPQGHTHKLWPESAPAEWKWGGWLFHSVTFVCFKILKSEFYSKNV